VGVKTYYWLPGCVVLIIVAFRWQDIAPAITQALPPTPTTASAIATVSFQAPDAGDLIPNLIERSSASVFTVKTPRGSGSGFAVKLANGQVVGLTNAHVVKGVDSVTLTTFTGVPLDATVMGRDEKADVAVLKLSAELQPLPTNSAVRQGDLIVAMGSPLGIQGVATVGRVSKTSFALPNGRNLMLGDIDIAPGNSGGCSLNLRGEVVGINSGVNKEAKAIAYLVPIATAMEVANAIAK